MNIKSNRRIFLQTALSSMSALMVSKRSFAKSEQKPNYVIILADDLGYGDVSFNGSTIQTPNIDKLSREGMTFTDFHTNGVVCSPTRAALLTGRYQQRSGVTMILNDTLHRDGNEDPIGLGPNEYTFAEGFFRTGRICNQSRLVQDYSG